MSELFTEGVKIRAQIDQENIRALLLVNGGASIALLAFLQVLIANHVPNLVAGVLWALVCYQISIVAVLGSSIARRFCSLRYERAGETSPAQNAEASFPCRAGWILLAIGWALFPVGSAIVVVSAFRCLAE